MRNIIQTPLSRLHHPSPSRHGPLVQPASSSPGPSRASSSHALAARRRLGPVRPASILVYRGGHQAIELPAHRRVRPDRPFRLVLCAALGWFPLNNIGAWVGFVAIYLVTLAAITAGFTALYYVAPPAASTPPRRYREGRKRVGHRDGKPITSVTRRAFPARKARCRFGLKSALISVWKAPTVNYYIVLR